MTSRLPKILGGLSAAMVVLAGLTAFTGLALAEEPLPAEDGAARVIKLLDEWQVYEARLELDALRKIYPNDALLGYALSRTLFLEGQYADALGILDAAVPKLPAEAQPALAQFRREVAKSADALKGFDELVTPDRRFRIRYQAKDALLMPFLVEVLTRQDEALATDFGGRPEGQVLVEIYPDVTYLAKVSPLTEKDLETSGTIALCKYNRLMVTSPRATVKGYGWRDTVAHELVHYYISKHSADTVPIWLHEGLAKFHETRWRAMPGTTPLDPPQEDLLTRSLAADKLVTFQQMHPSMAKLPSQEAAALAFAEVHMVIDELWRRKGHAALVRLIGRLRAGDAMDAALSATYGVDLDGLWRVWKKAMKSRGFRTYKGLVRTSLKFKRPGQAADADDDPDLSTITEKKVKDLAHLGELLRARGRHVAALSEYRKATVLGGDGNPLLQNGTAASLLVLGRPEEVPALLERVRSYYPGHVNTFVNLGEAHLKLGDSDKAREAFEAAVELNPFHPRLHEALSALYTAAGRTAEAERSRAALSRLQALGSPN